MYYIATRGPEAGVIAVASRRKLALPTRSRDSAAAATLHHLFITACEGNALHDGNTKLPSRLNTMALSCNLYGIYRDIDDTWLAYAD